MKCEHCNMEITNRHTMWSRSGHHWCHKVCYEEDQGYSNSPKLKPIMRKKRIFEGKGFVEAMDSCATFDHNWYVEVDE